MCPLLYTNTNSRFNSHKNSKDWFIEATHIHVGKCNNKIDMDIYELYYINKLTPPYNIASVTKSSPTFNIIDLDFKIFTINEFQNIYLSKTNKLISNPLKCKNRFENAISSSIDITNKNPSIFDISSPKFHWYITKDIIRFIEIKNYKFLKLVINYIINNNINLENKFKMPVDNFILDKENNCFIGVSYNHINCITYRDVISTGSHNFTSCVYSNLNNTPISCEFFNSQLIYLFKNNFELKHIINWPK